MILTDSSAAYIGANTNAVSAIASTTTNFRYFHIYGGVFPYNRAISGTTGLVKTGNGTLQTGQVFNYTGPTQINGGQLEISSASVLNGVISGTGSFKKSGAFAVTIGGDNTYSGGTFFSGGTITFSSGNAFGTGLFMAQTASQIITGNNVTLPNNFQINAGATMQFRTSVGTITITVTGNITNSGNLNKTGNGTLDLTAATLTYTGSTTITGGFIRAIKTSGASTATATFQSGGLSLVVSFNVSPPSGTTNFRFFQGTTVQTYASITLSGVPDGTTATYNSATSTLSVSVP